MKKVILKIKENLDKYKDNLLITDETDNSIKLQQKGDNKLPILFHIKSDGFTIFLRGWHRNFFSRRRSFRFFSLLFIQ